MNVIQNKPNQSQFQTQKQLTPLAAREIATRSTALRAGFLAMRRCMSYSGCNDATLRGARSVGSKGMLEDDFDSDSDKDDSAEGLDFGFEEVAEAFADADAEVG